MGPAHFSYWGILDHGLKLGVVLIYNAPTLRHVALLWPPSTLLKISTIDSNKEIPQVSGKCESHQL